MGHLQRFRRLGFVLLILGMLQGCSTAFMGLSGDYTRKDGIHLSIHETKNGHLFTVRNDNPHRTWVKISATVRRDDPGKDRLSPFEIYSKRETFSCALSPGQSQSWPLTLSGLPGRITADASIEEVEEYAERYLAVGDRVVLRNLTDVPTSFHLSCPVTVVVTNLSTTSRGGAFQKSRARQVLRVEVVGKERKTILSTRDLHRDSEDPHWPTKGVVECPWAGDSTGLFTAPPKITLRFAYTRCE